MMKNKLLFVILSFALSLMSFTTHAKGKWCEYYKAGKILNTTGNALMATSFFLPWGTDLDPSTVASNEVPPIKGDVGWTIGLNILAGLVTALDGEFLFPYVSTMSGAFSLFGVLGGLIFSRNHKTDKFGYGYLMYVLGAFAQGFGIYFYGVYQVECLY